MNRNQPRYIFAPEPLPPIGGRRLSPLPRLVPAIVSIALIASTFLLLVGMGLTGVGLVGW